jgi:hypothetical protein
VGSAGRRIISKRILKFWCEGFELVKWTAVMNSATDLEICALVGYYSACSDNFLPGVLGPIVPKLQ